VRVFFFLPASAQQKNKTLILPPLRGGPLLLPQAGEGLQPL